MPLALKNRAWNTIWLPIRVAWTALYWWLDAVNTVVTLPKQVFEVISNTTGQIKDVFSNAWNTWKWYNKLVNVPLSPFVASWTAIEWAIRAVVNPTWNAITHTRDIAWNVLVNTWNSIKWTFSDKPVSDFKYEHLKTSWIWTKNYVSKRQWVSSWWKKPEEKKDEKPEEKAKTEGKWKDEENKSKITELEAKNKNLESMLEKLIKQQEATNKQLAELLAKKENTANPTPNKTWKKIVMNNKKKYDKEVENGEDGEAVDDENRWEKRA